jgi:hypothetical protein
MPSIQHMGRCKHWQLVCRDSAHLTVLEQLCFIRGASHVTPNSNRNFSFAIAPTASPPDLRYLQDTYHHCFCRPSFLCKPPVPAYQGRVTHCSQSCLSPCTEIDWKGCAPHLVSQNGYGFAYHQWLRDCMVCYTFKHNLFSSTYMGLQAYRASVQSTHHQLVFFS